MKGLPGSPWRQAAAMGMVALLLAGWAWPHLRYHQHLRRLLHQAQPLRAEAQPLACLAPGQKKPLVILALGQSNAGNHGAAPGAAAPIKVFHGGRCFLTADPLPGSTGSGGSIWTLLPQALAERGQTRPVLISAIGLDATQVADWTGWSSPVPHHLADHLAAMQRAGVAPDLMLWQQGESDARLGRSQDEYTRAMQLLSVHLSELGYSGRILLARSTVCQSAPNAAIHIALESLVNRYPSRFARGADTDSLDPAARREDGCHLSASGLRRSAALWAGAIQDALK